MVNKNASFSETMLANVEQFTVEEVLPHSPPMVLLSKILQYDDQSLVGEINISEKSNFYDKNTLGVPSWVGLEYMAQAIAALAGVRAKLNNREVKLGFLLGARKYQIFSKQFLAGMSYQVCVTQLYMDDSGLASFDCRILHNQKVCVQSRLSVFEAEDVNKLLEN